MYCSRYNQWYNTYTALERYAAGIVFVAGPNQPTTVVIYSSEAHLPRDRVCDSLGPPNHRPQEVRAASVSTHI